MISNEIQQFVRQEIQKTASANRFQLSGVTRHTHNDTDSPKLLGTSVKTFQTMPSDPTGVFGVNSLDTQTFEYLGQINTTPILAVPLGIIQGFGVGTHSAFNGGTAPEGTMVLFTNGDALSFLCIKSENSSTGWFGVNLTTVG